jgi:hypothetical protein
MINKEKLRQAIILSKELKGTLSLMFIPKISLYSTKDLSNLYYDGVKKIETGVYLNGNPNFIKLTDANLEEVVEKIYEMMINDIHTHVLQALTNLKWKVEEIKNFEYSPDKYKIFQEEVLRLIEIEIGVETYKEEQLAKGHEPVSLVEPVVEPVKNSTIVNNTTNNSIDLIEKINEIKKQNR